MPNDQKKQILEAWTALREKLLKTLQTLNENKVYGSYALTQTPLFKVHPGWVTRKDILRKALKNYKDYVQQFRYEGFVPNYAKNENYYKTVRTDEEELAECDWLLKELGDKE